MFEHGDFSFSLDNFSGTARLLPLPDLLLFPHVMQPLHVVESRYCDLLEDALADDQLIALSVLESGWESNYHSQPEVFPFACLGKIVGTQQMENRGHNVLLIGLQRVRLLERLPKSNTYTEAIVELCDDIYPEESTVYDETQKNFRDAFTRVLSNSANTDKQIWQLLDTEVPLGVGTDVISYMLDLPLQKKKELLAEIDVLRRAEILLECLNAIASDHSIGKSGTTPFPPLFSTN